MSLQTFKTIDVARLEVAVPPDGLVNLVPNPNAALGAFGWTTSSTSAVLEREPSATANLFRYACTAAPSWFETTPMPMTAGHYAAASVVFPQTGAGAPTPTTMRFEWLDAEQNSITFSPTGGSMGGYGQYALGPQLAPAGTRFMRLTFDMATAGQTRFTAVNVASAPTAAELGSSVRNLVPNPSFEVDLYGWEAYYPGFTIARSTAVGGVSGTAALAVTGNGGYVRVGTPLASGSWHPVTAGKDYTYQFSVRAATVAREVEVTVMWYSGGAFLLHQTTAVGPDVVGSWAAKAATFTAPNGATYARFAFGFTNPQPTGGEVHYFDAVVLTEGSAEVSYFDGSTPDTSTVVYSWDGTAHASASIKADTTLGSIQAPTWRNVLGPTHSIKVVRESLDVGSLEADVLDSAIDPATSDLVRPGADARLLVLVDGEWEPAFTGSLDKIDVEYEVKTRPVKPPRVRLVAHDNTTGLSSLRRPNGVAAIEDLFDVIEGANVPWSINGYTGLPAGAPAAVVSTNDNATALDQIALTRDTALGHAWVDRRGVLIVEDTPGVLPAPVATYAEGRYSDLGLAFASTSCINAVEVDVLSLDAEGKTLTTTYGPYEDAASISQWGRRSRKFTVHGIAPGDVPAYAGRILTANSTPGVSVSQVRMPMRSTSDLGDTLRDLGDLVRVTNAAKGIDATMRVTRVEQTIEADPAKWMLTLGFASAESVAAPTVAPPLPPQPPAEFPDVPWTNVTLFYNSWVNYGGGFTVARYCRRGGVVYLQGLVRLGNAGTIFHVPAGFKPSAGTLIFGPADAGTGARIDVDTAGNVVFGGGNNAFVSLAGISYPAEQ